MIRKIRIGGAIIDMSAGDIETHLEAAFARREHPLCLCRREGLPMYVARVADRHVLKRMPGTGAKHDFECPSYDPPTVLSGLGGLDGAAIIENADDGFTLLKLAFSLAKVAGRAAPAIHGSANAGEVSSSGSRLSLRALLHYLWEQAGFNRWRPAMSGRRNWAVIRKFLFEAAQNKTAKSRQLADVLYIPEMFDKDREAAIEARRAAFLGRAIQSEAKRRTLALLIGEIKEITSARFGQRLTVKHAPGFNLMLAEDIYRRMNATFATELALWNAIEDSHLIAIATFGIDTSGIASIESIALMTVTSRWIPIESRYEATLIDGVVNHGAGFIKGLRYNLPMNQPMASLVLQQNKAAPVALYVVPDNVNETYRAALGEMIEESGIAAWVWETGTGPMPEFPKA